MRSCRAYFSGCGGFSNASARSRLFAYLPYFRQYGIRAHIASYTYHKFCRGTAHSVVDKVWMELLGLRNAAAFLCADTVWFQRNNFGMPAVQWAKWLGKRVVYDLDDAIYLVPPDSEARLVPHDAAENRSLRQRVEWMLAQADCVIVSGSDLYDWAARIARNVIVLPSVVDGLAAHPSLPRTPPVIGWVGAPENQRYLRRLEGAMVSLQSQRPELEVWIITSRPADPPPRFRHRFIPWSRDAEAEFVPQFTVGLAPLDDDPWCRAKMNYKAMVYMSHGVPAIASPIGFPVGDFRHGESVWYARGEDEWMAAMREVLDDRPKRDAVAREALQVLAGKYTAAAQAENWLTLLRGRRVL